MPRSGPLFTALFLAGWAWDSAENGEGTDGWDTYRNRATPRPKLRQIQVLHERRLSHLNPTSRYRKSSLRRFQNKTDFPTKRQPVLWRHVLSFKSIASMKILRGGQTQAAEKWKANFLAEKIALPLRNLPFLLSISGALEYLVTRVLNWGRQCNTAGERSSV
ncbi:hypothetical protein CEXT_316531 [Caerostris extrusa]|uniref:Secreted protein n=1 Tax=Caerostris extrusa TaxID=172846 RepID=A0AAV4TQE4_CAEEX|nr:hypothetical protein CEXT_316531 [Caerostris extrusa]